MKVANLARVKDDLSQYVSYVRRGGRVRILVNGAPAADLVPITAPAVDEELAQLEREGVLRRGSGGVDKDLLRPGPRLRGQPSSATIAVERARGW